MPSWPEPVARWSGLAEASAARHGVPVDLVLAVLWSESGGDPAARSPAGALGLMQLMPATAAELRVDPLDPRAAVDGGTRHLAFLARVLGGDWAAVVAAYNWGQGNLVRRAGWPGAGWTTRLPAETAAYVPRVLARAGWTLRGELAVPPRGLAVPQVPGETLPTRTLVALALALALVAALVAEG